jgi:hypothetical protein
MTGAAGWDDASAGRITEPQRRMLNAVCGDLARQVRWHSVKLDKDDWRHFLSGTAAGWKAVPAYDHGDGRNGIIMLGGSSLKLTRQQAKDAITMGLHIGDSPQEQGLSCKPVRWSDAVLLGLGFNPRDLEEA